MLGCFGTKERESIGHLKWPRGLYSTRLGLGMLRFSNIAIVSHTPNMPQNGSGNYIVGTLSRGGAARIPSDLESQSPDAYERLDMQAPKHEAVLQDETSIITYRYMIYDTIYIYINM